ncbi:NADPH-flavin oxidoreductase [Methanocella sp. CWC-04]|uniref:NADPH-flavin oxidoreductase n=1 Tax=Methanooceanicella nereidis TaxID=2052831 RepID=A0AAP2RDH9_9EURY|nr:flavin reductase family protein [Methanocella sp. CWC-04]MCD1295102.1 NADPH-flavin oxidoreductase [Methanocella sp. CWC-04]
MDKISIGSKPLLYPLPAVLVGSNVNGKPNYMTVAWSSIVNMAPPMVSVSIGHSRHTLKGIEENNTFSVNIPSTKQIAETDYCGIVTGAGDDKSALFESFYGKLKTAPMIKDCPMNMECKVNRTIDLGSHVLVIGEIIDILVDLDCTHNGIPDITKIDPMIFSFPQNDYFQVGKHIGKAFAAGKSIKK